MKKFPLSICITMAAFLASSALALDEVSPPSSPTNITLTPNGVGRAILTWTLSDGGSPIAGYEIEHNVGIDSWKSDSDLDGNGSDSRAIVSVTPGKWYVFRVRARNRAGSSSWGVGLKWVQIRPDQWDIKDGETGRGIVSDWPNIPNRFAIPDYKSLAKDYETLAFVRADDLTHRWREGRSPYFDSMSILQPSFLLHNAWASNQNLSEAVVVFPGILSSSLIGSDATQLKVQTYSAREMVAVNLVRMIKGYYHYDPVRNADGSENGLFTNHFFGNSLPGKSFWYLMMPNIYAMQIQSLYSATDIEREKKEHEPTLDELTRRSVDTLVRMTNFLKGNNEVPSFECSGVQIAQGKFETVFPKAAPAGYEPDAAGSMAYIGVLAYQRWKDPKYLSMAEDSLRFLMKYKRNPFFELELNYGALAAARMNRQHGRSFNVKKLMNWIFSRSNEKLPSVPSFSTNVRPEVGVLAESWGTYPVYGLWGGKNPWAHGQPYCSSCTGYAFYMNTISQAVTLAPIVKYYPEYATLFGKYLLNVASNSKVFFHDYLQESNQHQKSLTRTKQLIQTSGYQKYFSIPFESLRKEPTGAGEFIARARGDAVDYVNARGESAPWAQTNQSLYSGALTGMFASMLIKTDIPEVPLWDLNKTDFQSAQAFPTFLAYNPRDTAVSLKERQIPGATQGALWDMVNHIWLIDRQVTLNPGQARVLVVVPFGAVCPPPDEGSRGVTCDKPGWDSKIRIDYDF
jgi:hypothetical protein